jgi:tetratricopeptide (TPR) repeat protein
MDDSIKKLFENALKEEKNNQSKSAIEKYKAIVKKFPSHFESWLNLGAIYLNLNKYENALICFQSCLKLRKDFRIYYNIGLIHYKSKRFTQASEYFKSSIILKKDFLPGYLLSGYTFAEEKKFFQAIQTLEEGEKNCGQNESLLVCLAIACYMSGDYVKSANVLDKILKINPRNKTAKKFKAKNSIHKKVTKDSLIIFKELINDDPVIGEIDKVINAGKNSELLKSISQKKRELICKKDKSPEDYLNLSLISFVMGNGNAAMDFLGNSLREK